MRRVAAAINFSISPATWAAVLVVVAGWIAGALFIAHHIASTPQAPLPPKVLAAPEPSQTPNRAAKAARKPFKQARLTPDPSAPSSSRQAPQEAPQAEAAGARAETGRASWYDLAASTTNGEAMDSEALTAAHPSLPFGSKVRVANLDNGRSVVVRINDRGPFGKGRIIDVSRAAAAQLGMLRAGVARVSVNPVEAEVASDKVASASDDASPLRR